MKTCFEYRSYVVSHDRSAYNAVSIDGEPFQLRSKNMLRVIRAIDNLWNAVEHKVPVPGWFLAASDLVDLDAASEAMLITSDRPAAVPSFPIAPVLATPFRVAA